MKNKWALITGGTKGIGWSIAKKFASQGINLILTSRSIDDLNERRTEIIESHNGVECAIFRSDLSNRHEVRNLAEFAKGDTDVLDILVNNAGIFMPGSVLNEEEGALESQVETNLYSAYYLTRDVMPLINNSKRGYIINMCSIASFMAYAGSGSYTISKFALRGWSKTLREELKDTHIAVTSIMPGATWSASWEGADYPRERLIEPENVAEMIWSIINLAPNAVVEELVIRPQKGDL
ncbi:MAG: SDR family oxidoreductase [Saprospiraceae bacterium]|nr:SDR family oxidoreductase [Saprospiraceae bacterium]